MSRTVSEKSVFLVNHLSVRAVDYEINIDLKDIHLPLAPTDSTSEKSPKVDVISEKLTSRKRKSGGYTFFKFHFLEDDDEDDGLLYCVTYLSPTWLRRFCEILPSPFLQFSFRMKDPANNADSTTLEKRLNLQDIMKDATIPTDDDGIHKQCELFSINDKVKMTFSIDIILGWTEAGPPKMTPIRMGAASFLQNMYGRDASKDLILVARNGAEIKCHRAIFEAHGDVLAAMISPNNGMVEARTGKVQMTDNSEVGLSLLVRYFYGLDVTSDDLSSVDVAVELFTTAHRYLLTELLNAMGKVLLERGDDWWTPSTLIKFYFHLKHLDEWEKLQEHVLSVMIRLSEQIRSCERFQELSREDAMELVWKLFDQNHSEKASPAPPSAKRRRMESTP